MPATFATVEKSDLIPSENSRATVTVVTVARNCVDSIDATMLSVAAQRGVPIEYIVIDGASTDGTADRISLSSVKPDIFISEPDAGIYNAMNKAISLASGDFIIFMNAGDRFASTDSVARLVAASADSDIVYGDIIVSGRGVESSRRNARNPRNYHHIWFCHQAALVRTSLMKKFGFDERYRLSADFEFFKKCKKSGFRFRHIDYPVAIFDITGASHSGRLLGLKENFSIVSNHDSGITRLRFQSKLIFQIFMERLRILIGKH